MSLCRRYNPADIEADLSGGRDPLVPPVEDRKRWSDLAGRIGGAERNRIVEEAGRAVAEGIPALPASLYLDYAREGRREPFAVPFKRRREQLADLVLAECMEDEGRFLDPILDLVWAICEESSWAQPAHQVELRIPEESMLDLTAAMTAIDLAEAVVLLASRLEEGVAKRVYDEVDRRCLAPFLERNDHHWLYDSDRHGVNNWAAVCITGVVGAALHLEPDPARCAQIVYKALRSLDDYLATFGEDGGSSEGPGYWSYGFGMYTLLGDLLERATRVDLFAVDPVPEIALFPLRTTLTRGAHVPFSDSKTELDFWRGQLHFLARRLGVADLARLAGQQPLHLGERDLARGLRELLWAPAKGEAAGDPYDPPSHDWLPSLQWMIARQDPADPNALVLAMKGGHNAEMHNHNDVGSLVVHLGGESLITDLGRGRYTRKYWSPERYELFVRSSRGHSVPVVNGVLQGPTRFEMKGDAARFRARVLEHGHSDDEDLLRLDLTDAYLEDAGLENLERRTVLDRKTGTVRLCDTFRFHEAGEFESVLVTLARVEKVGHVGVRVLGSRSSLLVEPDPSGCSDLQGNERQREELQTDELKPGELKTGEPKSGDLKLCVETVEDVELAHGTTTVTRIVFRHPSAKAGAVALTLTPQVGSREGEDR